MNINAYAQKRREAKTKIWFGTHGAQEFEMLQKNVVHARRFGGRKSGRPPQRHLRGMLCLLGGLAAEKWPAALNSRPTSNGKRLKVKARRPSA